MLGIQRPPVLAADPAQQQGPQQVALACSPAQLQVIQAELRQTYRQLSVSVHPDKCSHPLASKVSLPCHAALSSCDSGVVTGQQQ